MKRSISFARAISRSSFPPRDGVNRLTNCIPATGSLNSRSKKGFRLPLRPTRIHTPSSAKILIVLRRRCRSSVFAKFAFTKNTNGSYALWNERRASALAFAFRGLVLDCNRDRRCPSILSRRLHRRNAGRRDLGTSRARRPRFGTDHLLPCRSERQSSAVYQRS